MIKDLAIVDEEILEYARQGFDVEHICGLVGVHPATFKRWLRLGNEDEKVQNEYSEGKTYGEFYIRWLSAQGEHRAELKEDLIFKSPKSIEFVLKSQYPEHFGDRRELKITSTVHSIEEKRLVLEQASYQQVEAFLNDEITFAELKESIGTIDVENKELTN